MTDLGLMINNEKNYKFSLWTYEIPINLSTSKLLESPLSLWKKDRDSN